MHLTSLFIYTGNVSIWLYAYFIFKFQMDFYGKNERLTYSHAYNLHRNKTDLIIYHTFRSYFQTWMFRYLFQHKKSCLMWIMRHCTSIECMEKNLVSQAQSRIRNSRKTDYRISCINNKYLYCNIQLFSKRIWKSSEMSPLLERRPGRRLNRDRPCAYKI